MSDEQPLVYMAGPYTDPDPVLNTHNAIKAALLVERTGAAVFIPHLTLLWHLVSPSPLEEWYRRDMAVLARCDALVRIPGKSSGADVEVKFAVDNNFPVFNYDGEITALRRWVSAWKAGAI